MAKNTLKGDMMDAHLHTKLDEVIEEFKGSLHQQAEYWSKISTPSELFDFEQGLQAILNSLQAEIVGAVLEAIHRDRDFVADCQSQAWRQSGVNIDGWHNSRFAHFRRQIRDLISGGQKKGDFGHNLVKKELYIRP